MFILYFNYFLVYRYTISDLYTYNLNINYKSHQIIIKDNLHFRNILVILFIIILGFIKDLE